MKPELPERIAKLSSEQLAIDVDVRLNKLAKWRNIFAGRMFGTGLHADPQDKGRRDLFEKLILLRAELTALTGLLISTGVIEQEDLTRWLLNEAIELDQAYEKLFPGITTSLEGTHLKMPEANQTMKGWPP